MFTVKLVQKGGGDIPFRGTEKNCSLSPFYNPVRPCMGRRYPPWQKFLSFCALQVHFGGLNFSQLAIPTSLTSFYPHTRYCKMLNRSSLSHTKTYTYTYAFCRLTEQETQKMNYCFVLKLKYKYLIVIFYTKTKFIYFQEP